MYFQHFYPQPMHPAGYRSPKAYPHGYDPYYNHNQMIPAYPTYEARQQTIQGQATWTEGGPVTQCGMPWSHNEYMTVAVGENSPYECGQALKVKYLQTQRELIVTVVDRVQNYPPNRLNLHRRAFEALGANTDVGVINVEITPSFEIEEERWGKYLLEVTQAAYPNYRVTDYRFVGKKEEAANRTRETYEFSLQSPQETINVQGTVIYHPQTDRVISFDIKEA